MDHIIKRKDQIHKERYLNTTLGRKGLERLDFLLLAVESIEINSIYSMLQIAKEINIEHHFSNSVELWKSRAHNPLRKAPRRGSPTHEETEALIVLVSSMSNRIYPHTRQLMSSKEPSDMNLQRWELISERFFDLVSERMNSRRVAIQKLSIKTECKTLMRELILILAFSAGPGGKDRLSDYLYSFNI